MAQEQKEGDEEPVMLLGQRARTHQLGDEVDMVDGKPIDWSTHTYGGLGTLHDGTCVIKDPKGAAVPCTFDSMQRRATEQRAWAALDDNTRASMRRNADDHLVDPRAVDMGTFLLLHRDHQAAATLYLDTSYTFMAHAINEPQDKVVAGVYMLGNNLRIDVCPGCTMVFGKGEYIFVLKQQDAKMVLFMRFPELKSHPGVAGGGIAAASRKQRTCAACGQVWHQTMLRCAACNEVPYCSRICQRHHWRSHKAVCKRTKPPRKTPKPNG